MSAGRSQLARRRGRLARGGFSLVELVVVLAVVMILAGLLFPVLARSRADAAAVRCRAQMRQVGAGLIAYAGENRGMLVPSAGVPGLPGSRDWPEVLFAEKLPAVVVCPTADRDQESVSYLLNMWLRNGRIRLDGGNSARVPPAEIVLAGENRPGTNYLVHHYPPSNLDPTYTFYDPLRHGPRLRSNYLWLDGHVSKDPPVRRPGAYDDWDIPRQ